MQTLRLGLDAGQMAGMVRHLSLYLACPRLRTRQRKGYPGKSRFRQQPPDICTADHCFDHSSRHCCLEDRRKTALAMGLAG